MTERTSREAIAATLRSETGIPEAEAVVDLTLAHLARVHLLELPNESHVDRSTPTRRWLLGRGLTAALLPAIYSIVAPSPLDAQSVGGPAPTLTSLSPNQGSLGTTVTVTLTGTNFVIGATTITVNSGGVTASNVIVSSATSLTVDIAITATATTGAHTITVTTAAGTSAPQIFTVSAAPPPPAPTLTSVAPNRLRHPGHHGAVTLTGTNFVVGATTVAVAGGGVTVNNIVVGSATSLTADFVIGAAAAVGRTRGDGDDRRWHKRTANLHDHRVDRFDDVHLYGRPAALHSTGGSDDVDGDRTGCARRKRVAPWRNGGNRGRDAYRRPG